jgi:hypothetical protein
MREQETSFFESFNARQKDPVEVAQSFVPSIHFDQLCGNWHSLLVGPRGSGKTTFLKMLQPRAIESWNHPEANRYRKKIKYSGIFIPSDISWGAQVDALGYGKLSAENHRTLSVAAFTTHVLRCLTETMLNRVLQTRSHDIRAFRRAKLNSEDESSIVSEISSCWRISPSIPSLLSLKHSLRTRLSDIRLLGNRGSLESDESFKAELANIDYLHLHFIDAISVAIELFNDYAGEQDFKWALLFDELETAPDWIQDELVRAMRSVDQKIIIKLAISPFSSNARLLLAEHQSPAPGQDLRPVRLWYPEKANGYAFCRDLWDSMIASQGISPITPEKALGYSYFDPVDIKKGQKQFVYGDNGIWTKRFISLANRDKSFIEYLRTKGLEIADIGKSSVATRDAIIRKIAPIVAVREYYRADEASPQEIRSRKTAELYTGADSIFAVTEGNPRWFIGIVDQLISGLSDKTYEIPKTLQASLIEETSERFLAMLRISPINLLTKSGKYSGLERLIKRIGEYFFKKVVLDNFAAEPPLSFTVDQDVDEDTILMLETALNRGAILHIPDDDSETALTSLRGKRFRLSYMLAASYGLPLRLGKTTALSKILSPSAAIPSDIQSPLLFGGPCDE